MILEEIQTKPQDINSRNDVSFEEINQLIETIGWGECYYKTEDRWHHIINISSHLAYVRSNGQLIRSTIMARKK